MIDELTNEATQLRLLVIGRFHEELPRPLKFILVIKQAKREAITCVDSKKYCIISRTINIWTSTSAPN